MQEQPYRQEEPGCLLIDGSWRPEITAAKLHDTARGTLIGGGGYGLVYKYVHTDGTTLAVKDIVYRTESDGAAADDKMLRESEIQSKLQHRNIIALYYAKVERQSLLLVMEYAAGGSLFDALHNHQPSLSVLVDWATQIADGMSYLHKENVVHRDLKSSNVLLKEPWPDTKSMKICDFGFARDGHRHTAKLSDFRGTKVYSAPEVTTTGDFSKFSDVWSFGVTLWEMLTGKKPYKDIGLVSTAYEHSMDDLRTYQLLVVLLQNCWRRPHSSRPTFEDIVRDFGEVNSQILLDETQFRDFRNWFSDHTGASHETLSRQPSSSIQRSRHPASAQETSSLNLIGASRESWGRQMPSGDAGTGQSISARDISPVNSSGASHQSMAGQRQSAGTRTRLPSTVRSCASQ